MLRAHSVVSSLLLLLMLLFLADSADAQRRRYMRGFTDTYPGALSIGLIAGGNYDIGMGAPVSDCDCTFETGSGFGYHAGLTFDIYLYDGFALRLSGIYQNMNVIYTGDEQITGYLPNGSGVTVAAQRRIETDPTYLNTGFSFIWYAGRYGVYLSAGATVGFAMDGGRYLETSTIKDEGYVFTNGSNRQVRADHQLGDAETLRPRIGLLLGIGYDFPISRSFVIAPELSINYPFTTVTEESDDWKIPTVQFSVLARFGI